jgi:glucose/arabinose dehydrogenase
MNDLLAERPSIGLHETYQERRLQRWTRMRALFAVCALTLATSTWAAEPQGCVLVDQDYGPAGRVHVRAETVVSGLEIPWAVGFLPGGDMLVTERPGRVRLVHAGKLVAEPVATVDVSKRSEDGLLGLAVDPDFRANRAIYLYYTGDTRGGPANRVERWTVSADARHATRDRMIVDGIPAAQYHDGGRLRFGPDGMLYVGTGDSREPDLAQDTDSLAGKILRMTRDGAPAPGNPWPGRLAYVKGLRNVEGFDWDVKGRLYVADHGPSGEMGRSGHDRVLLVEAGANAGWPKVFGCGSGEGFTTSALSWNEAVPPGGAAVYTGRAIAEWKGDLIVGTLKSKHLHRVHFDAANPSRVAAHEVYLAGDPPAGLGRVREVVMGPDGVLYVTTSNCDGRGTCPPEKDKILRIVR